MSRSILHAFISLVFLALNPWVSSCQNERKAPTDPSLGTETNWLKSCNADSECEGLRCECGICTRRCSDAQSCGWDNAVCSTPESEAVSSLCTAEKPTANLCLPACQQTCAAGLLCVGGACIPNTVDVDAAPFDASSTTGSSGASTAQSSSSSERARSSFTDGGMFTSNDVTSVDAAAPDAALDAAAVDAASDAVTPCETSESDQASPCVPTCEFDSCHLERCDQVGEPCCDPQPGDGPNYCNAGLLCLDGTCTAP